MKELPNDGTRTPWTPRARYQRAHGGVGTLTARFPGETRQEIVSAMHEAGGHAGRAMSLEVGDVARQEDGTLGVVNRVFSDGDIKLLIKDGSTTGWINPSALAWPSEAELAAAPWIAEVVWRSDPPAVVAETAPTEQPPALAPEPAPAPEPAVSEGVPPAQSGGAAASAAPAAPALPSPPATSPPAHTADLDPEGIGAERAASPARGQVGTGYEHEMGGVSQTAPALCGPASSLGRCADSCAVCTAQMSPCAVIAFLVLLIAYFKSGCGACENDAACNGMFGECVCSGNHTGTFCELRPGEIGDDEAGGVPSWLVITCCVVAIAGCCVIGLGWDKAPLQGGPAHNFDFIVIYLPAGVCVIFVAMAVLGMAALVMSL
jgi:hypothetical protein